MAIKHKALKIASITIAVLMLATATLYSCYTLFFDPYRETVSNPEETLALGETLTREQAQSDLEYMMNMVKEYHPIFLEQDNPKTDVMQARYESQIAALGENVTVAELWRAAGRIENALFDGHTGVYPQVKDKMYISDFTQLKEGNELVRINGTDIQTLFETFKEQSSYERAEYAKALFESSTLLRRDYLEFCGVDTENGVDFTFLTEDGEKTYHYDFVTSAEIVSNTTGEKENWVRYSVNKEKNLAVFTLDECDFNDEYRTALGEFFRKVNENVITNIAVDLRENGGGNSLVADEFITYLDVDSYKTWASEIRSRWILMSNPASINKNEKKDIVFSGNVYVLTSVNTFSSAMDFAMLIGDNDIGKIVGEASGNMPDSYGDILRFQMPNSKLVMSVSFKSWHRVDTEKEGEPLTPDYEVPSEEALDKVYALIA